MCPIRWLVTASYREADALPGVPLPTCCVDSQSTGCWTHPPPTAVHPRYQEVDPLPGVDEAAVDEDIRQFYTLEGKEPVYEAYPAGTPKRAVRGGGRC